MVVLHSILLWKTWPELMGLGLLIKFLQQFNDNSSRSLLQVDNHIWYYIHWHEIKADLILELRNLGRPHHVFFSTVVDFFN